MNILVTGGAGFIGSQLIDHLLHQRHSVITIDNLSWGKEEFIKHNYSNPKFKFLCFDLLESEKLNKALMDKRIDVVFHLAANSDIRRGVEDPKIDFKNTTKVTFNVLEAMRKNKIKKIFYTSGSGVYGNVGNKYTMESYGPLLPVSMYGATKLSAEAMISAYVNLFKFQAWILRPANIIGPRATHGVIFDFINKLKKDKNKLQILGDGRQSKSYLYIEDVIQAIDLVWKKTHEKINLYNIASNTFITATEIASIIIKKMDLINTKFEYSGGSIGWVGDVPIVRINNTKIKKLGWHCHYSSKEAVKTTVNDLLDKNNNV